MKSGVLGNINLKNTNGFSLIEILISMAIIVIASTALVPLAIFLNSANYSNQQHFVSNGLAASILEQVASIDYDAIGTVGGNPSGSIPQTQVRNIGGRDYTIKTLISWESAIGNTNIANPVALKKIRVTVEAANVFTGVLQVVDEIYGSVSKEGEVDIVDAGHIRTTIKNASGNIITSTSVRVNLTNETGTAAVNQSLMTDSSGQTLFGILPATSASDSVTGYYRIDTVIPYGYYAFSTVTRNVMVKKWQTTELAMYMDKADSMCSLNVVLKDKNTGNPIIKSGKMTIILNLDGIDYTIIDNKVFTAADFTSDKKLRADFIGKLWPNGIYKIKITNMVGYSAFDMSLNPGDITTDGGNQWLGSFSSLAQNLNVNISMTSAVTYLYKEDNTTDFDNYYERNGLEAVSDILRIKLGETKLPNSSISNILTSSNKNNPGTNAFDGDDSTYWQTKNRSQWSTEWIRWTYESNLSLSKLNVLLDGYYSYNNSYNPKNYEVYISADGNTPVTKVATGFFNNANSWQSITLSNPVDCKSIELRIITKYANNYSNSLRINEISTYSKNLSGYRITNSIPLAQYTFAPYLKVTWGENKPANTDIKIYYAIVDNTNTPNINTDFTEIPSSGDIIPNTYGANLSSKNMYILERLNTTDPDVTPGLDWLYIEEKD